MRRFVLDRRVDVSGVSGPGVVVWGVQWPDLTVAYRWNTPTATTAIAATVQDVEQIHLHNGATDFLWVDGAPAVGAWPALIARARDGGNCPACARPLPGGM